jgi:hypothetical protein
VACKAAEQLQFIDDGDPRNQNGLELLRRMAAM